MVHDLACPRRRHARVYRGIIEIHCRWCSGVRRDGSRILHRWAVNFDAPEDDEGGWVVEPLPDVVVPGSKGAKERPGADKSA